MWSTDWFQNPRRELQRVVQAIQTAQAYLGQEYVPSSPTPVANEVDIGPQGQPEITLPDTPALNGSPYVCATIRVNMGSVPMHDADRSWLAELLAEVVKTESPVHWKEAARRVITAAGIQKLGSRIENAFIEAVRHGCRHQLFIKRGEFLWRLDMESPPVRDRSSLPVSSRKLDLVAPEEIDAAILKVVQQSCGMNPDEVPGAVCRLLGFARVTDDMKNSIEPRRDTLLGRGALKANGQKSTPLHRNGDSVARTANELRREIRVK